MIAIDTNVFVYSFDASEPDKQRKAREFLQRNFSSSEEAIVPWQVAAELLARFRRWEALGVMGHTDVIGHFDEFLRVWPLAFPTAGILHSSFALHDRYSLSHWDSMLVAACLEAGARRLYSEDMQHGANYNGLEIVNPFL